jgi:UDP-N-acetylglucosamine pyrophosphorylase
VLTILTNDRYHLAFKKIHYADGEGNPVLATVANGYKLEQFIFDVFEVRHPTPLPLSLY